MSKNCVLKGTLITLENNITKKIEKLKVGEKILSYSIEGIINSQNENILRNSKVNTYDGEYSYQLIKNIWKNNFDQYYKINNNLKITDDHYILCKRNNEYFWNRVGNLIIGDYLFKSDNTFEIISEIEIIKDFQEVYNIQVNSIYSYFANNYLVHNGTPCTSCTACGSSGGSCNIS
jgi:hypothetical protein